MGRPISKTLWCVEMSTNMLYSFDMTAKSDKVPGKSHGKLLSNVKATDCRAMCVGNKGKVCMAVTEHGRPGGPQCYLVSFTPGDKSPRDHGQGWHRQSRFYSTP